MIIERAGCLVEIQLRTRLQDLGAQLVEQESRRSGFGLKFGQGPADLRAYYRVLAAYCELLERRGGNPETSVRRTMELFAATRRLYHNYHKEGGSR